MKTKPKKERIMLPNGCSCSTPSVFPPDWKTCKSSALKKDWRIQYYFYDPNFPVPTSPKVIKGMNSYKDLQSRREITKSLLNDELTELKSGYNPYLKKYTVEPEVKPLAEMNPDLKVIEAFRLALSKYKASKHHIKQVENAINRFSAAVIKLRFSDVTIMDFKRSQLKQVFDILNLTDEVHNKFKSYFSSLFKILIEYECCETNLTRDIQKRTPIKNQREVLSYELIQKILEKLKPEHPEFYRYGQIFLHSGGRSTELFSVQARKVRLEQQEYDVLIKKGKQYVWETKIIIQNAVPFWTEIMEMCKSKDDFLFSHGLIPGQIKNDANQITRRWLRYVKRRLVIKDGEIMNKAELDAKNDFNYERITADFYSMKHTFLDLLDATQNEDFNTAKEMASHRTDKITHKVYTGGKKKRENERLKMIRV